MFEDDDSVAYYYILQLTKSIAFRSDIEFEKVEPAWVCMECALDRGARCPEGHLVTMHTGTCGICKEERNVTEPRDFGITRNKLKVKS
jgi:hypothetical protein